jgi:hypothetical protein
VKRLALALSLAALMALPALARPFQHFKASMSGSTNYLYTPTTPLSTYTILLNGAGGYVTLYSYPNIFDTSIVDSVTVRCPAGIAIPFLQESPTSAIHQFRINRDDIVAEVYITGGSN